MGEWGWYGGKAFDRNIEAYGRRKTLSFLKNVNYIHFLSLNSTNYWLEKVRERMAHVRHTITTDIYEPTVDSSYFSIQILKLLCVWMNVPSQQCLIRTIFQQDFSRTRNFMKKV